MGVIMITVNTSGTKLSDKYILSGKIQKKVRTAEQSGDSHRFE